MFKIDEGSVLPHWPHVCHICGSGPTKGEFAIDTEVLGADPNARHMQYHKYVCQKCAEEIASHVPDKAKDKLKKELAVWKGKYGELAAALDGFVKAHVHVAD